MLRQEHCKLFEAAQESLGRRSVIVNSPYESRINGFRKTDKRLFLRAQIWFRPTQVPQFRPL